MLISSFILQIGLLNIHLLLFYLQWGPFRSKKHRFFEYFPCFDSFEHSAVDARRPGDENPISSVVAETMKLLANKSNGYHIRDRIRHTVKRCLGDRKTHVAINSKLFRKLNHVNNPSYEVELAKFQIEHKEPIKVGFSLLELCYSFLNQILWCKHFRRTGSRHWFTVPCSCREGSERLYATWNESAVGTTAVKKMYRQFHRQCILKFFPRMCCDKHKKHEKRGPGFFKEEFRCSKKLCLFSKI